MANRFKRLFAVTKVKTSGSYALRRLEEQLPTPYLEYGFSGGSTHLVCGGFVSGYYSPEVIIAHATYGELVTAIGTSAFSGTNIVSVTIPDTITLIGGSAFANCTNLASVTFLGTIEQWNAIFKGSTGAMYDCFRGSLALSYIQCRNGVVPLWELE